MDLVVPRYCMTDVRETTWRSRTNERFVSTSSWTPSVKNEFCLSSLMFSNGRTAIDLGSTACSWAGAGAAAGAAAGDGGARLVTTRATAATAAAATAAAIQDRPRGGRRVSAAGAAWAGAPGFRGASS